MAQPLRHWRHWVGPLLADMAELDMAAAKTISALSSSENQCQKTRACEADGMPSCGMALRM